MTDRTPKIRVGDAFLASQWNRTAAIVDEHTDALQLIAEDYGPEGSAAPAEGIEGTEVAATTVSYPVPVLDETGTQVGTATVEAITSITFDMSNGESWTFNIKNPTVR